MDACAQSRFFELLHARRRELDNDRARQESVLVGLRLARADASADDEHDPEGPTLSSEWSRLTGLTIGIDALIGEIDRAIHRVHDGTYGACLRCGHQIAVARLEARPAAELCIRCASDRDHR